MIAPALSESDSIALGWLAEAKLSERRFLRFLSHCMLRSDDPLKPVMAKWQPWPFLVERALAWESRADEIDLKARQLGFSWLVAMYSVWRARAGASVALISKGQLEARELLAKCAFVESHLPKQLQSRCVPRTDDIKYASGGYIMAFPSTPDAGVSFTFQLVIMDEGHFHAYAAANYGAIRPTISAGGQFIALSTADPSLGPNGWFPSMYWASKRGETGYAAVFTPWSARPDRDMAWRAKERSAFTGMPEEFDAFYPDSDAEAFTGKSGLVYPMFSEQRHVSLIHPWKWEDSVRHVAGIDFGGGDPTACLPHGLSGTHKIHQFGEFYQRGPVSVYDLAHYLGQWPAHNGLALCDPSEPVAIETLDVALKGTGWRAVAADNKRGEGLGLYAQMLADDMLTIHVSCENTIAEFPGYRWAERTDPNDKTRYQTKTPVGNHADGKDAGRYAVMELLAMTRNMVQIPKKAMNGQKFAGVMR